MLQGAAPGMFLTCEVAVVPQCWLLMSESLPLEASKLNALAPRRSSSYSLTAYTRVALSLKTRNDGLPDFMLLTASAIPLSWLKRYTYMPSEVLWSV